MKLAARSSFIFLLASLSHPCAYLCHEGSNSSLGIISNHVQGSEWRVVVEILRAQLQEAQNSFAAERQKRSEITAQCEEFATERYEFAAENKQLTSEREEFAALAILHAAERDDAAERAILCTSERDDAVKERDEFERRINRYLSRLAASGADAPAEFVGTEARRILEALVRKYHRPDDGSTCRLLSLVVRGCKIECCAVRGHWHDDA